MKTDTQTPTVQTLHEIVSQSNALTEQLLALDGELTPELEAELDRIGLALVEKVDSCALVLERLESEAELWEARARKYANIGRAMAAARERVRGVVKAAMIQMNADNLLGDEVRFALVKSKAKVVYEGTLDPAFMKEVVVTQPDKEKVDACLRQGQVVKGARLEPVHQLRPYANRGRK